MEEDGRKVFDDFVGARTVGLAEVAEKGLRTIRFSS
jgi:hypothetical protein